ncbi:glycosyltransferase family 4 protein [Enterovibrio sp. ZSDZ35]|uniref:Glycosyltransferase family 4 protein n=1 Tax=Enterovibrio qingdaonensis TaxID=2899818 RepID=A0ABT5QNB4_9GAMM|nr:glycosyltransferase family 4 protein [Enterovibrio sp. ZSDZ35]MDD1782481.1 glycosyltransferase family 4 protein [Enterovibrio sp. ZSDZ35]
MDNKKLTIYAPDIHEGDAVGNHCIGLAKLARRLGYSVKLYAKNYSYDSQNITIKSVESLIKEVGPEELIFVSYSIFDPSLEHILRLPNRKICYFHDVTPPNLLRGYDPATAILCEKALKQISILSEFDVFISNSEQSARLLESAGIKDQVNIIPPVFGDSFLFNRKVEKINENNVETVSLLSVGRVVPHKRIEDSISVLSKLSVLDKGRYRLRVVGSIPNKDYFKFLISHARKLDVLQYVTFCGMVSQVDLDNLFISSQVLISMSDHEGFCIPILEAMYLGKQIILKKGTAADEFASNVAMNVTDVKGAVDAVLLYLENNNRLEGFTELTKQASLVLERTNDNHWAKIFYNAE